MTGGAGDFDPAPLFFDLNSAQQGQRRALLGRPFRPGNAVARRAPLARLEAGVKED